MTFTKNNPPKPYKLWIVTPDKKDYWEVSARTMEEAIKKGQNEEGRKLTTEEIKEVNK